MSRDLLALVSTLSFKREPAACGFAKLAGANAADALLLTIA